MKVLMLSKACIVGAYQKKLEEMAALPNVDLTVVVPTGWHDPRSPTRLERVYTTGYELIVTDMALNGRYHTHFYPRLGGIVRRVKPDIFHIDEEPYNLATFQAMRLARWIHAVPVVFTWQNLLRRYPPPFSLMERYVLRHTKALLIGNEEARGVWHAKGYRGPMYQIPQFGVDPTIFYRRERPMRQHRASILRHRNARTPAQPTLAIGYVGRLVEEKGVALLLHAASRLVGPWTLQILGGGPDKRRLESLSQWLGIGPRVTFDQKLPSLHIPNYFSGLDVLVLPSLSRANWKEQFGRVLIEAMACDVITVGARSGAIPEVIGEAGLTFEEGNADDLQTQLQRLIDDVPLRESLREAGRRRVRDHYTQAAVARNTVKVYHELLQTSVETVP